MDIKPISIIDLVFTSQTEHKKIALDGHLELKDKLLNSNFFTFNTIPKRKKLQWWR
ncbi:hypothetical protein LOSG293_110660 [Secundilactobacillus oryzae JCM 18671]|uniref:Uncharacterized protein n=1 Tax=Secundilactobacillus oryzae JCM 18671 TaxID=1291743 RepID=A0A081BI82_9LACO|nr:hypothetical protein [Secundilactobacillus oryzae]GAK47750.1 hypothetical protein LOSG293_110660 [Secundilactobacillus oryzae JCM 18671]